MPDNTVAIKLQVNLRGLVNINKLNDALATLNRQGGNLKTTLANSGNAVDRLVRTSNNAAKTINAAAKATGTLNKAQQGAANNAGILVDRLGNVISSTQRASTAQGRVATAVTRTASAVRKLSEAEREEIAIQRKATAEKKRYEEAMKSLSGRLKYYEQDVDALFRAGYRLQMLGSDLQNIARDTFGALKSLSDSFANFEFMALRAGGALSTPIDKMDELQVAILDSARSLKLFDPTEVAEATYYWASTTGQAVETQQEMNDLMEQVAPIMKAAAMTNTQYETAIKGVFSILTQYGLGLEHTADVTEKLFKATNVTAAEFPDLINSFKMVGPIARENNVTLEDMIVQFGRLADVGIRGTMVGRAFRQLFIQLARPSARAKTLLDELWASTEQFAGKSYAEMVFPKGDFVGIDRYVDMLAQATKDMTVAQRNSILATITTANELPVITALVSRQVGALNGLGEAWDNNKYAVGDATEYFEQAWGKLGDSWKAVVASLTTGAEIIRIQLGGRLAQVLEPFFTQIAKWMEDFSAWINDPANSDTIDFFIKLAAGIAAAAGATGLLLSLAGGLIAAGAAASLMVRAFSPLTGAIGGLGVVVVATVRAVADNFNYLLGAAREIGDNLSRVFGDAERAAMGLGSVFSDLANTLLPLMGAIIRTIADFAVGVSRLLVFLSQLQGPFDAFAVAIRVISTLIAVNLIARILMLNKVMAAARVAFLAMAFGMMRLKLSLTGMAASLAAASGVMGKAKIAAMGLGGAIKNGIRGALSGNWIAAAVSVFLLLYEAFPPLKDAVDNVADSFRNLRQEIKDAISEGNAGVESTRLFNWLEEQATAALKATGAWEKIGEDLRTQAKSGQMYFVNGQLRFADDPAVMAQKYEEAVNDLMQTVEERAQKAGVSMNEYLKAESIFKNVDASLTFEELHNMTDAFFQTLDEDTSTSVANLKGFQDALLFMGAEQDWVLKNGHKSWEMLTGSIKGAEAAINAIDQRALDDLGRAQMALALGSTGGFGSGARTNTGLSILGNLMAEQDKYGPEVQKAINDFWSSLSSEQRVAIDEFADEGAAAARVAPGEVAQALIQGTKDLRSLPKTLRQVMKNALRPDQQMSGIFRDFFKGTISKGFRDSKGNFVLEARLTAADGLNTAVEQWQRYADRLSPPRLTKFTQKMITQFNKDIPKALPKRVPEGMRRRLESFITMLYDTLGEPVPQEILDKIWKTSKNAGEKVPEGVAAGATGAAGKGKNAVIDAYDTATKGLPRGKPGVAVDSGKALVNGVVDGIQARRPVLDDKVDNVKRNMSLDQGNKPYNWGAHYINNFISGMNARIGALYDASERAAEAAGGALRHTVPKYGPLKDDDKWGGHFMDNIVNGIQSGIPELSSTIDTVAQTMQLSQDRMAMNSGVTYEQSSRRAIDVNVKVTSPDGSVDRVKTAQLESALLSSDIVTALEHMATVG